MDGKGSYLVIALYDDDDDFDDLDGEDDEDFDEE